jgi:hypothetical protein
LKGAPIYERVDLHAWLGEHHRITCNNRDYRHRFGDLARRLEARRGSEKNWGVVGDEHPFDVDSGSPRKSLVEYVFVAENRCGRGRAPYFVGAATATANKETQIGMNSEPLSGA